MDELKERKRVDKVITGEARPVKKSLLKKIFQTFVNEDIDNIGAYILYDVLIPMTKNAFLDVINDILGGKPRGRSSSSRGREWVSYGGYYDDRSKRSQKESRRTPFSYSEYVYDTREEAIEVLERMNDQLATYDIVTVGDFYDFSGVIPKPVDFKYGWTNISKAKVVPYDGGYMIRMPKAMPID